MLGRDVAPNDRSVGGTVALKFEKSEILTRKEAAARLTALATALEADGSFDVERDDETLKLDLPDDDVIFEFEVKLKDDEVKLEVEIKWEV
jgi:amphi-Trp domain-containing protein